MRRSSLNQHTGPVMTGFWLVLLFIGLSAAHAERLPVKIYTTADGLAQDWVRRIVRDSRGYLWFCTAGGLSRFDGYQFTNYTTDHGLPHHSVHDFLETRHRTFWIATADGLCQFNPMAGLTTADGRANARTRFTVYRPNAGEAARRVNVLQEDRAGTIWAGTADGL